MCLLLAQARSAKILASQFFFINTLIARDLASVSKKSEIECKRTRAYQNIGHHPNKVQNFGHDQIFAKAYFGHKPNIALGSDLVATEGQ